LGEQSFVLTAAHSSRGERSVFVVFDGNGRSDRDRADGRGFASLSLLVQGVLRHDPLSGHLFRFRGRRGDLLKVIWHDGQGARQFTKRLERGRFLWPSVAEGAVTISPAQLGYLLSGSIGVIRRRVGVRRRWDEYLGLQTAMDVIPSLCETRP
jgi:transposase